jgi:hypothetical protein
MVTKGRRCRQDWKSLDGPFRLQATCSFLGLARELAILLCRIWTGLMLKRAIRLIESTHERDCRDLNLNKVEALAVLRCLHDVDRPPLTSS